MYGVFNKLRDVGIQSQGRTHAYIIVPSNCGIKMSAVSRPVRYRCAQRGRRLLLGHPRAARCSASRTALHTVRDDGERFA